jgi:hypothetical protein
LLGYSDLTMQIRKTTHPKGLPPYEAPDHEHSWWVDRILVPWEGPLRVIWARAAQADEALAAGEEPKGHLDA